MRVRHIPLFYCLLNKEGRTIKKVKQCTQNVIIVPLHGQTKPVTSPIVRNRKKTIINYVLLKNDMEI